MEMPRTPILLVPVLVLVPVTAAAVDRDQGHRWQRGAARFQRHGLGGRQLRQRVRVIAAEAVQRDDQRQPVSLAVTGRVGDRVADGRAAGGRIEGA